MAGWLGVIVGLAIVATAAWQHHRSTAPTRALRRRLQAVPTTKPDGCAEGTLARVTGVVTGADELLTSPSDDLPCVFYAATFDVNGEVASRTQSCGFWLACDDGAWVWIEPAGADFLPGMLQSSWFSESDATPRLRAELELLTTHIPWRAARVGYVEGRILPGERVTVLGCARWRDVTALASSIYRGGSVAKRVLSLETHPAEPMIVALDEEVR